MTGLPDDADTILQTGGAGSADPATELAALRTLTAHNMRLLKAQIIPLIDAALRASGAGAGAGAGVGAEAEPNGAGAPDHRVRWTRTALRLIDDTAIAATAGAVGGAVAPVDFRTLLRQAAADQDGRLGSVTVAPLPLLLGRAGHLRLLADQLMLGIARIAGRGLADGLRVGRTVGPDGAMTIWFQDGALPSPPPGDWALRAQDDDRTWSVCRNLMTRSGGGLQVWQAGRGQLYLALRFPAEMVLEEPAG